MYSILILDDEKWIRRGIRKMLEKDNLMSGNFFEASNSIEGEKIIRDNDIDIIISDVKMPGEDGCNFCKRIKEEYPDIKIIMVSGYNEFNYVKNAIGYGAADYLLKPINKRELNNAISKVVSEIERERASDNLSDNLLYTVEGMFFEYLIQDDSQIINRLDELIDLNYGDYKDFFMIGMEISSKNYSHKEVKHILYRRLEKSFKTNCNIFVISNFNYRMFIIVLRKNNFDEPRSILQRIQVLFSNEEIEYVITLSKRYSTLEDLQTAYKRVNKMLDNRIISGDIEIGLAHNIPAKYVEMGKKIVEAVDLNKKEVLLKLTDELTKEFEEESNLSMKSTKLFLVSLMYDIIKLIYNTEGFEQILLDKLLVGNNKILNSYHIDRAVQVVYEFGIEVIDTKKLEEKDNIESIIKRSIKYINENYKENITLAYLAKRYYVNSTYLSHKFKEITGETLISYLTSVRLKEAKRLLEEYNIPIRDVANSVGYSNETYFFRVFRRHMNMSPSEYREGFKKDEEN